MLSKSTLVLQCPPVTLLGTDHCFSRTELGYYGSVILGIAGEGMRTFTSFLTLLGGAVHLKEKKCGECTGLDVRMSGLWKGMRMSGACRVGTLLCQHNALHDTSLLPCNNFLSRTL